MYTSHDNPSLVKIITLLKSHKSEYLSGQDLSDSLSLSRAAVWKHIKKLQSLGYKIESKPKLGYKLIKTTESLFPWEISVGLKTNLFGKRIYFFDSIDSTQNFAIKIASKKTENGALVISEKQTHGRGRQDRKWISPPGGIWISLVLHPDLDASASTLFPLVVSLALAISIEKALKIKCKLKWPNDVTIKDKKIAGVLVDASIESGIIEYMILGIGINFKINPKEIEKKLIHTQNYYGVASLLDKKTKTTPLKLVQEFLFELERLYQILCKNDLKFLVDQWTKRSSTIGRSITITLPNKTIRGKALKIEPDGALILSSKGKNQRIIAGDVSADT